MSPPASIQYFYTNATSNISPQKKNQGGLPTCKHRRCAFNQKHIHPPTGGNFIRLHLLRRLRRDKQVERKRNVFTSDQRERLHKQGFSFFVKMWRKGYAFWVKLCFAQWREDLRRRSPFFLLSKMLLWDCLHFIQAIPHFCKKNGGEGGIRTPDRVSPMTV